MSKPVWIFRGTTYWAFGHQLNRAQVITLSLSGVLFIGFGLLGMIGAFYSIYNGYQSSSWEIKSAEVKKFNVVAYTGKSKGKFKLTLVYQYQYDGIRYESERIRWTDEIFFEEQATEMVKKCQGKTHIPIYVNPSNPQLSVVMPGIELGEVVLFGLCGGVLLCGVWFLKLLYFK